MSAKKLIGVTDLPIERLAEDNLQVDTYINGLTNFIATCNTPMTIALQGDWGTGKTSFINLVNDQLEKYNDKSSAGKVQTIMFNTWKYSQFNQEQNLSISFLSYIVSKILGKSMIEVLEDMSNNVENEKGPGVTSKVLGVIGRLAYSLTRDVATQAVTQFAGMPMADTPDMLNDRLPKESSKSQFERVAYIDSAAAIEELKEAFEQAVAYNLKKSGADRIIIFIDDLDRLDPVVAVDLLEIIKLFLDVPKCVFVLAVDYGIVSKGVKLKHGDLQMDDDKANSFFDKMIQVPFRIPMEFYNFDKFLKANLPHISDFNELQSIIRYSVGNNPRGVKRLLNSYYLISNIMFDDKDETKISEKQYGLLITILCMQLAHEPLYQFFCLGMDPKELLKAKNEEQMKAILQDIDLLNDDTNLRKHYLFLKELQHYIFNGEMENLLSENPKALLSEDAEANIDAFLTIISYSTITSERVTIEEDDLEEMALPDFIKADTTDYRVDTILCAGIAFTKKPIVGRVFEIYERVIGNNKENAEKMTDYKQLPEMGEAGIERRLLLPWVQRLDKDAEKKAWIEKNAEDFIYEQGKYVDNLPKRKLPGTDYEIIINYNAVKTVQNLYAILKFLDDPIIDKIVVRVKKEKKTTQQG